VSGIDPVRELTHDEVVEMGGAFVLGALEPDEAAAVRAHLATCTQDHSEIAELGATLPVLAESVPIVEPPAGLKTRIMAAAAAEAAAAAPGAATVAPVAAAPIASAPVAAAPVVAAIPADATPFPTADDRAARRERTSPLSWALRIAAVVAIVALGASTLLLRNQLNDAQAYQQAVTAVIDAAGQPGALTAVLTADGDTGTGLAAVTPDGRVTLAMQDLAPTSGATVYTAWVIGGDGVPVDIGSFNVGRGGTASFSATIAPATAGTVLALTREPGPGATTPTLPIISKGVATAAG
jgi:anti-sigma-K factor RskA